MTSNIVTCCKRCNDRKYTMSLRSYLEKVSMETGESVSRLLGRVLTAASQPVDLVAGQRLYMESKR